MDERKKQKGRFLPILGSLSEPLLISAVDAIGGEILKELGSKIFGKGKRKEEEERWEGSTIPRSNILLQRHLAPKRVQLPNGRVFFAKYQRVGRYRLPERLRIRRTYVRKIKPRRQRIRKIGPRNQHRKRKQVDRGLDLSTAIDLVGRAAGSRLDKMMINDAIDYIPTAYKKTNCKNSTWHWYRWLCCK